MATELTAAMREFLSEARIGVLAGIKEDGSPQLTPIWFLLEGDEILINTARERVKGRIFEREPRASFCVFEDFRYLTLSGRVTISEDSDMADIKRIGLRYKPMEFLEKRIRDQWGRQQRITLHLKIEHVVSSGF